MNSPRSAFLVELHAGFGVPRSVVVELAERATQAGVEAIERVVRGYDNEVYRVRLNNRRAVYVRIGRSDETDFGRELWAMEQARVAGVPVPEVLWAEDDERPAMVVAEAPGRQLGGVLESLSPDQRHVTMVETGRTLALLHAVSTPGFWRPDGNGRWPDADQVRTGFIAERMAEHPQLRAAGFAEAEVERIFELLNEPGEHWTTPAVLCHNDVFPEHIFVDEDLRVSCLIDWGMWCGGNPMGELAYAAMVNPVTDFAAMMEGYGIRPNPGFRRTLGLSTVGLAIGNIAHHVTVDDLEQLRPYVIALRQVLHDLS